MIQTSMIFGESQWRPVETMPTWLFKCPLIALDTETYDPGLLTVGPGYCRKDGFVIGVSIAAQCPTGEIIGYYLPFGHTGDNMDMEQVRAFLNDLFRTPKTIVFANATYDMGWLHDFSIKNIEQHVIRDVQVAEALLDEERWSYSLDSLSKDYLGRGKAEDELQSLGLGKDYKSLLYTLPARFVGKYAEIDAVNTLEVYLKQIPLLKKEGLWPLFEVESEVSKVCYRMTINGVRVDLEKTQRAIDSIAPVIDYLSRPLKGISVTAPDQVAWYLEKHGVELPKTEKTGKSSTKKEYLEESGHKEAKRIVTLRNLIKLKKDFLENGILKNHINGRIHSQFHQLKSDGYGTVTGRFSSSQPNLQQVPKRSKMSKIIRACYIPEEGEDWISADYSSQEPRMQVHFALLNGFMGAEEARDFFLYEAPKGRKIYNLFADMIPGVSYGDCKNIHLGRSYGMGIARLAVKLGVSYDEAKEILGRFDTKIPYVKQSIETYSSQANADGYIRTIYGRKRRFDNWLPDHPEARTKGKEISPIRGYDKALTAFRSYINKGYRLVRAGTHKAFNARIQGSSADQTKLAAVRLYELGYGPYFRLQVHDELDFSVPKSLSASKAKEIKEVMEGIIKLKVPVVSDVDVGGHW